MADHQSECEICDRIAQCRRGDHPGFIAEMETGFAVLGDSQLFRGYSLLLCKDPVTELDELPRDRRLKHLEEMALLAEAVRNVVKPHKINYECLGTMVHHIHWHLFPRRLSEPEPLKPVWVQMDSANAPENRLDPVRDGPLIADLRAELARLRR